MYFITKVNIKGQRYEVYEPGAYIGRHGTRANYWLKLGNKWFTPFEIKTRGMMSLDVFFQIIYNPGMEAVLPARNYLLEKIKPDPSWTGGHYVIPVGVD